VKEERAPQLDCDTLHCTELRVELLTPVEAKALRLSGEQAPSVTTLEESTAFSGCTTMAGGAYNEAQFSWAFAAIIMLEGSQSWQVEGFDDKVLYGVNGT